MSQYALLDGGQVGLELFRDEDGEEPAHLVFDLEVGHNCVD